ncbi:hypothetical protein MGYG_08816 [Nannizzia gypsea CBS 118893]|uniref:MARVEL domain-containing protein n=1 Tax=Arthroderma gypseum (strain ATCC MYA-4604 / CBS 118893) TaxID=535722 RepID=E4V727_ARTGP|nr:hypothetical protein MGYG_08816 [Nannizzia gypsea CBS 118893]EFQ96893.1 hypothetical protein MGYG_08816 [Nannizzia gypsea CBS 118893]
MASDNALRLTGFGLRMLQLSCSLIIVGVFGYFLAVFADHNAHAPEWLRAVAGIAGVAAIYAILASFFILAYGGPLFFSHIFMLLDGGFALAFLSVCIMTRHGALPCTRRLTTPVGSSAAKDPNVAFGEGFIGIDRGDNLTFMRYLSTACNALFLLSIPIQRAFKKRQRSSKSSSSPVSHTSAGFRQRFWPRRRQHQGPSSADPAVEYSQAPLSSGAISLEDKPKGEKPRFTSILQRLRNGNSRNVGPEDIQLQQGIQNNKPLSGFNPSYGPGKSAYTVTSAESPISPALPEPANPWARPEYLEYTYGQRGIDVGEYSRGYGYGPHR